MNVLDLFSGCGGISSGFKLAGFNISGGVDIDPDSIRTFQKNFPKSENLDILKSNSYYYDKFFKENIDVIINMKLKKFVQTLKKIYGSEFEEKKYLNNITELEKFDYTLKNFILEKANLDKKKCFNFFYEIMGKILADLYLLPKMYIIFY